MARRRKPGPATKLTARTTEAICAVLRLGGTYALAAQSIDVRREAISRWLRRGREHEATGKRSVYRRLLTASRVARSRGAQGALATIIKAQQKGDWKAAAWFLTHCYRKQFGKDAILFDDSFLEPELDDSEGLDLSPEDFETAASRLTDDEVETLRDLFARMQGGDVE